MTFVFKGTLEHYDTASKKYTPLDAGGVQVTQTGSGVKHSEKIIKGTHLFQIWFDPDFSKSLKVNASYRDYQANEFKTQSENGVDVLNYIGKNAPITSQTQKLEIQKRSYTQGKYTEELDPDFTYSYYLLEGEANVQDILLSKDGFIKLSQEKALHVEVNQRAVFFVIKSPTLVDYTRFIERY